MFAYAMRAVQLQAGRPARIVAMRKIDWGGAGQISEALGQDRVAVLFP